MQVINYVHRGSVHKWFTYGFSFFKSSCEVILSVIIYHMIIYIFSNYWIYY